MLARFSFFLPFDLFVRGGDQTQALSLTIGEWLGTIPPLSQSSRPVLPGSSVWDAMLPASNPEPHPGVTIEGRPAYRADLLQVELRKAEFDRLSSASLDKDPPVSVGLLFANEFLRRLRSVTRFPGIAPLLVERDPWRLDYLNDDGSPLEPRDGFVRRRVSPGQVQPELICFHSGISSAIASLPKNFQPHPWEFLILDAQAMIPNVGPAVVLAYSAIEIAVDWVLDVVAEKAVQPPGLWSWLSGREPFWKNPSTSEKLKDVLPMLTGKSLVNEEVLWDGFSKLQKVRHSFAHEGIVSTGGRRPAEVSVLEATDLIRNASQIIDWLEALVPSQMRRTQVEGSVRCGISMAMPL